MNPKPEDLSRFALHSQSTATLPGMPIKWRRRRESNPQPSFLVSETTLQPTELRRQVLHFFIVLRGNRVSIDHSSRARPGLVKNPLRCASTLNPPSLISIPTLALTGFGWLAAFQSGYCRLPYSNRYRAVSATWVDVSVFPDGCQRRPTWSTAWRNSLADGCL